MSLISERQEDKGLSLGGAKTVQKNIEILIKREVKKITAQTESGSPNGYINPNFSSFPKNPGVTLRQLWTAVEYVGPTAVYVLRNILKKTMEDKSSIWPGEQSFSQLELWS